MPAGYRRIGVTLDRDQFSVLVEDELPAPDPAVRANRFRHLRAMMLGLKGLRPVGHGFFASAAPGATLNLFDDGPAAEQVLDHRASGSCGPYLMFRDGAARVGCQSALAFVPQKVAVLQINLYIQSSMISRRTNWNLSQNQYTQALADFRASGRKLLDLTMSNPTEVGLHFESGRLLSALSDSRGLEYEPVARGLLEAREAVGTYYGEKGIEISPEQIFLTVSTSEAYGFAFRLLCDPGDEVLVPQPSYPLFEFLADLQDVKLVPYELIYDHGWQIDFHSLECAITSRTRGVLVVHPNNPTGSYVKQTEKTLLDRICSDRELAIIADEVFLDYSLASGDELSFAGSRAALTFTLSGLSKISGLPQMKVAWMAVSGPEALAADAIARLEVIADTYLSVNAPLQWALPEMLASRRGLQEQLRTRVRENLAELD